MVLADCTKVNVLDILSTIPPDKFVVAVLCLCRDVIVKELRLSPDQFMLEDYPPVLFLLEKNNDVVALRQLLILNPLEVECSVREDLHSPMTCFLDTKVKTTLGTSTGKLYMITQSTYLYTISCQRLAQRGLAGTSYP